MSKEYADVLIATPTAELTTQNSSARPQTNEDEIGLTYDQIYYFGKLRSNGYGMITMFDYIVKNLNKKEIQDLVIPNYINKNENVKEKYIKQKLIIFFNKYKTNRHKTVILTPSVHLLPSPDDNRFDLRPFLYPEFTEQTSYIENQISGK
jgi:NAD+ synthase (glutamine-hydrolysing)